MRIWDIDPGYLNRHSLLGEHRELHGIVAILMRGKKAGSRHPETLRWSGCGWALRQRHRLLVCEMELRSFCHHSPVLTRSAVGVWPGTFIDGPAEQFRLLESRYALPTAGRIPLPVTLQQLWSQHKYSILARNPALYSDIGREVATNIHGYDELAMLLVEQMRLAPSAGGIRNALEHMWGYVKDCPPGRQGNLSAWTATRLLHEIQRRAIDSRSNYLLTSTALSELMAWL